MTAQVLDGRVVSANIKADVAARIQQRTDMGLPVPGLDVILVGNNPSSTSYVNHKRRACQEVGIVSTIHHLPEDITSAELEQQIELCNRNPEVHGILLQLPLPLAINPDYFLEKIHPGKDVDGFHPYNIGRLASRRPGLRPCTPFGIMQMLRHYNLQLKGKHAVIIGASNIVGRPMAFELLLAKCTVTVAHRYSQDLAALVAQADILVVAIGKPGVVQTEWIKPGAVVVDVGFTRLSNGEIQGDVDFNSAQEKTSWITPVPGGVGPMTVATLMQNTLQAAEANE